MERVTALPASRVFGAFALMVFAALAFLLIFRPGDETAAAIDLGNPVAWVEHGIDGELLQINGLTGEIASRIDVAEDGDDFVAVPHGDGAVVLNTTSGVVSLVNGAELVVSSTIDVSVPEDATSRDVSVFGSDALDDEIFVIDEGQILEVDPGRGLVLTTPLPTPISTLVQDSSGVIYGVDGNRSSVVRIASDGASPFAVVDADLDADLDADDTATADQRQLVRTGGRVFALDPARLSMAEVLPGGGLGDRICMRSVANGAVHGGAGPNEEPIVLSLNAQASILAVSTADGDCNDLEVDVANGEYGAPVAINGVAYIPFWDQGRIISIDLETGETLGDLPFGTRGEPFELEIVGSTVWANERLGPFAAVVQQDEITPIAKLSAVRAAPGNPDEEGDGSTITSGNAQDEGLRVIGETGAAVITAENGSADGNGTGRGNADPDDPVLDQIGVDQLPVPQGFGISADAVLGDEEDELAEEELEEDESEDAVETEVDSETELPELNETLVANFVVSTGEATVGEVVRFTDSSLGSPVAWSWTFGDGTSLDTPDAEKVWDEEGLYEIVLTVTNQSGASSNLATTVNIVAESVLLPPNADFQFSSDTIEEGESINFVSRTTGEVDILEWDFGNGRSGIGEEVAHTFDTAGTYRVVLTASNEAGSTTSAVTVEVLDGVEPPVAAIAPIPSTVTTGQFVTFESVSLNDPTRSTWGFGDGTNASGETARHSWDEPGEYRIVLGVENSAGSDRTFADIRVEARVVEPVSRFTQSATEVLVGEPINFTDLSLNDPDRLTWDFDDGETSSQANPRHSWDTAGTYRVTLRATNEAGTDRTGVTITVNNPVDPPVASFNVNTTVIATGSDVRFEDTSQNNPDEWIWEFEGSGTSAERNPFRRWDRAGTYTVRLTAVNEGGRSSSEMQITVIDPPTASFRFEMVSENRVRFIDQSQNVDQWRWNFGDGSTSNEQNPTHDFAGGSFDVTLTTTNQVATAGPATQRVTISNPPVAVASCSVDGRQLNCTSEGSERAVSFRWEADGAVVNSNPEGANTTFAFASNGRPNVRLTVTNAQGESDSVTIRAPRVLGGQEPRISDVRIASIDGNLVRLESVFDRDPTNWEWSINGVELVDGGNTPTPTFRVPGNGTFSGQVTASNAFGDDRDPVEFTVDTFVTSASFTWDVIEPGVVRFQNTSNAQAGAAIEWRFNGAREILDNNEQAPVVRFRDSGGTFRIVLTVSDNNGRDVERVDITVPAVEDEEPPEEPEDPPEDDDEDGNGG